MCVDGAIVAFIKIIYYGLISSKTFHQNVQSPNRERKDIKHLSEKMITPQRNNKTA